MTSYELNRLNDKEFEELATHIIEKLVGCRVERFKPGKDQGVDGRFFCASGEEAIIQAKHWYNTGIGQLLAHLKKSEVGKVKKLKPARYLLVTSVPLSRANKQAILDLFTPYIKGAPDILGNEDIQDFLRHEPELVKQHYKLWLASSDVLSLVFNAPIIGRSSFKMDEVIDFIPKYVTTQCYEKALDRLNGTGTIIIIGEPGIGKSTLAEQMVLHYALNGHELCFVENDLSEAEAVWVKEKKQVFYFDDFLGRNYLDVINGNHDSHVFAFMRRVGKDKSKRFILTSRTTIMQQGKSLSELFRTHNVEQKEYEIRIVDLTALEKAKILYNHIWFGNLNPEFIEQLYINKRYREIVGHRNFNPRLIAFITDSHKIAGITVEQYWSYILKMLDDPRDVWRGVFENQLDQMGRLIVSLVVFHGGQITETYLRACCERARTEEIPTPSVTEWSLMFERSFQMTVGAVTTHLVDRHSRDSKVGLFNPSVGDFILHRFANDEPSLSSFLALLRNARSLEHFHYLHRNGIVSENVFMAVIKRLGVTFWSNPKNTPEFTGMLASYVVENSTLRTELKNELIVLSGQFFSISELSEHPEKIVAYAVFIVREKLVDASNAQWENFVRAVIDCTGDDMELKVLSGLIVLLDEPICTNLSTELAEHVIDIWKNCLSDEIRENGVASDYTDHEYEYEKTKAKITSFVRDSLSGYAIDFNDKEIDYIVAGYDIHDHIQANQESAYSDYEGGNRGRACNESSGSELAQIDDLFERDK